jgi:hypothetical protein
MSVLSVDLIMQRIQYDPATGAMTWKDGPRAGAQVGATDAQGYIRITVYGRTVLGHRVAWAISNGSWPDHQIDHVNGVRHDNRLSNLRDVDRVQNGRNQKMNMMNSSGAPGVHWSAPHKRWRAYISVNRKRIWLGLFQDFEDAVNARKAAERNFDFHPNHGRAG